MSHLSLPENLQLSQAEIDNLLAQAKTEALAEVRARLKTALVEEFTRQALAPPATSATGLYLYAILPAAARPLTLPDSSLQLISHGPLQAVAQQVNLYPFEQLNQQPPAWLTEQIRRHQQVLNSLLQDGPLLPLRFGVIFPDKAALLTLLTQQQTTLTDWLARLGNKQEWGVKIYQNSQRMAQSLRAANPALVSRQNHIEEKTNGAAYLWQKKINRDLSKEIAAQSRYWVELCHRRLAGCASDCALLELQPDTLFNAAYLLAPEEQAAFEAELQQLAAQYGQQGLNFELTGPWPAFNFARFNLTL